MISSIEYEYLKSLIEDYERGEFDVKEAPYLIEHEMVMKYNPDYGDGRICECGHPYHRHFDSYEDMEAIGCKYCGCYGL